MSDKSQIETLTLHFEEDGLKFEDPKYTAILNDLHDGNLMNIIMLSVDSFKNVVRHLHYLNDYIKIEIAPYSKMIENLNYDLSKNNAETQVKDDAEEQVKEKQIDAVMFVNIIIVLAALGHDVNDLEECMKLMEAYRTTDIIKINKERVMNRVDTICGWSDLPPFYCLAMIAIDQHIQSNCKRYSENYPEFKYPTGLSDSTYLERFAGPGWRHIFESSTWPEGLVLAGGSLISCLTYRKNNIEDAEDLDFWVVGKTMSERLDRFNKALTWLLNTDSSSSSSSSDKNVVYSANKCAVTLTIPGLKNRQIQLIYTCYETAMDLVLAFDMANLRAYYDKCQIGMTREVRLMVNNSTLYLKLDTPNQLRIIKTLRYPIRNLIVDKQDAFWKNHLSQFELPPLVSASTPQSCKHITNSSMTRLVISPDELHALGQKIDAKKYKQQRMKYVRFDDDVNIDRMHHAVKSIMRPELITTDPDVIVDHIDDMANDGLGNVNNYDYNQNSVRSHGKNKLTKLSIQEHSPEFERKTTYYVCQT